MAIIDLHSHSTASDGTDSPAELIDNAVAAGLSALALTDHDTVAGLDEAEAAAKQKNLYFVPGCELSTRIEDGSVHLLALWAPREDKRFDDYLSQMRQNRINRNAEILRKLNELGVAISEEELRAETSGVPGRPHMAAAMVRKGYVKSAKEAFAKYLGENAPAHVRREAPSPEEAARFLSDLGASVSLAHPFHSLKTWDAVQEYAEKLAGAGLTAIEAWHSTHSEEQTQKLLELARRLDLAVTGGTDYHGEKKKGLFLGVGYGNMATPESALRDLIARRKKNGLPCEDF